MEKIHQSLELLNYKLKKNLSSAAIKVFENEKYNVTHEGKDIKDTSSEDIATFKSSKQNEVRGNSTGKTFMSKSCGNLKYPSKNAEEDKKCHQNLVKNSENDLVHNDCDIVQYYCLRNITELSPFKNSEDELIRNECDVSFDYSSRNASVNKETVQKLQKIAEDETINKDRKNLIDSFRDAAKIEESFRNPVKDGEYVSVHEAELEENLECQSRNVTKSEESFLGQYNNCENHEIPEKSSKLNVENRTSKRTLISAVWSLLQKSVKQTKEVNISLLEKVKVIENPKYLPEYKPSLKEIEEDRLFQSQLKSFFDCSEKILKDLFTCQDKTLHCFQIVKNIYCDIEMIGEMLSDLEDFLWVNKDFELEDLIPGSKEVQNINSEKDDIKDQKTQTQICFWDQNFSDLKEKTVALEKDL